MRRELAMGMLRGLEIALFLIGGGALCYWGAVQYDAWQFQQVRGQQPTRGLAEVVAYRTSEGKGEIGRLEIPRLGISVLVLEGTSKKTLRRALGHIGSTALPGERGNMGISGHRDTFFRPLRNIRRDDVVTLQTAKGEYRYRVVATRIVSPSEVSVLAGGDGEVLTLVTCYPFYFIGDAPERFIVRAERIV